MPRWLLSLARQLGVQPRKSPSLRRPPPIA